MPFRLTADCLAAVTLRVFVHVLTVGLALTGYGCGDEARLGTPVSPSPPVQGLPPASPVEGELWSLTTTIVSLEGSACFWTQPVGKQFDWTLSVERNGAQVRFVYDVNNPHDNLSFVGPVDEESFTAVSDTYRSFWQCAGGVTLSSSVIGSFLLDGRTLSGRERLIYRVDSGGELIITFEWNAARR